ncbi:MAG: O-antigen ligase family protein [Proteobacteria bacterium]|nr:O-antigen ligase family protein [Pseudomonadota bacterium]
MNGSTLKNLITARLFIPGLVFLWVNLTTSYMFYQVNSYKIALLVLGIGVLMIRNAPVFPGTVESKIPWKAWGVLAVPLLATIPGYLVFQGSYNYNFRYELATNLTLILWVGYLYRGTRDEDDLRPFLALLGLTVVYTGLWSVLEKIGYHPLDWGAPSVRMVKSTFGHRNYYSGFLIILLPLLLVLSIPENLFAASSLKKMRSTFTKSNVFYMVALGLGGTSLLLAQTRAAIAACLVSVGLVVFLYALFFAPKTWRKRLVYLIIAGFVAAVISGILMYVFADQLKGSRIAALFTLRAWVGRLLPWQTALTSLKEAPLTGFGLGSSYNLFFSFVDPEARLFHHEHSYNHAHSEILEYLQESGALGAVAFLCFWGYLVFQVIKILRNPSSSPLVVKLAIGVCGGFLAYNFHSVFSVAPRMMVMKLPLFTFYGLVFIFLKLSNPAPPSGEEKPSIRRKIVAGMPSFLIVMLVLAMYLPWMAGQYQFVKLQHERPSFLRVEKLEKLVEIWPDIYALDYLSHQQVQYRRTEELEKTIEKIEGILPHYREVGHTTAILAVMNRDLRKAVKAGLEFQKRDQYYKPSIFLLMGLAAETNNYDLFFKQFQLLLRKFIFEYDLIKNQPSSAVQIRKRAIPGALIITAKEDSMTIEWNEKLFRHLFEIAKSNRRNKSYNTKERERYWKFLVQTMLKHPYFQVSIRDEFKLKDNQSIQSATRAYFGAKRDWEIKQRQLTADHRTQLERTAPAKRNPLKKKQAEELEHARNTYRDKIDSHEKYLRERTEWDVFLTKQKVANEFSKEFIGVIFPSRGR